MNVRGALVVLALVLALVAAVGLGAGHALSARGGTRSIRHVATPHVQAQPRACYVDGQTCSIHPCVEFVAAKPPRLLPRARIAPSRACVRYPRPTGTAILVGH